jgi:hypothetical protein
MVFLDLIHMLMTVPNLFFLFMRLPLIPFGFYLSNQLLIRFFCSWQRQQAGAKVRGGRRI